MYWSYWWFCDHQKQFCYLLQDSPSYIFWCVPFHFQAYEESRRFCWRLRIDQETILPDMMYDRKNQFFWEEPVLCILELQEHKSPSSYQENSFFRRSRIFADWLTRSYVAPYSRASISISWILAMGECLLLGTNPVSFIVPRQRPYFFVYTFFRDHRYSIFHINTNDCLCA